MSVMARCGGCQKQFKLDDKLAGRKVRCKTCGGVIVVPGGAGAGVAPAAPRRATASAPAAAPPPAFEESPFEDVDALMSLETTGAVYDTPPPARAPSRRGGGAAYAPPDDAVTPPPLAVPPRRGWGAGGGGARPAYRGPRSAYVSTAFDDWIDAFVPLGTIGVFVLFLLITSGRVLSRSATGEGPPVTFAGMVIFNVVCLLIVFGMITPICMLGVLLASKVMRFERPGSFFARCAAAVCAPMSAAIIVNGFGFAAEPSPVSWVVSLTVMLGVLWLMFRLKPLEYAVTGTSVLLTSVGLPVLCLIGLLALLGVKGGLNGFGEARARAQELKNAANMQSIGRAMYVYAQNYKGKFPPSLEVLKKAGGVDDAMTHSLFGGEEFLYLYFDGLTTDTSGDYVVMMDSGALAATKRAPLLYADGHVETVEEAQARRGVARNEEIRKAHLDQVDWLHGGTRAVQRPDVTKPAPTVTPVKSPVTPVTPAPPVTPTAPTAADRSADEAVLRRIDAALRKHAAAHGGAYPYNLYELRAPAGPLTDADLRTAAGGAFQYGGQNLKAPAPANVIVAYSDAAPRLALFADGRITVVPEAEWKRLFTESINSKREAIRGK